jgi:hypothetical protein
MNVFKPLDTIKNLKVLRREVEELVEMHGLNHNQLMLQTYGEGVDNWYEGVGRIDQLPHKIEHEYKFINDSLKGSNLESLINRYSGTRARIMVLNSTMCYTLHSDPTPRIHIPIVTNKKCMMCWPEQNFMTTMPAGMSYWTDTTHPHTFFNASEQQRIHIVMCSDLEFYSS